MAWLEANIGHLLYTGHNDQLHTDSCVTNNVRECVYMCVHTSAIRNPSASACVSLGYGIVHA